MIFVTIIEREKYNNLDIYAKALKPKEKKQRPAGHEKPVKIEGEFLEVFKVVKKNKEDKAKKPKKD